MAAPFDNIVTEESSKSVFLAWAILTTLLLVFFIAVAVLYWKKMSDQSGAKVFMSITAFLTVLYTLISCVWWYGLYDNSEVITI